MYIETYIYVLGSFGSLLAIATRCDFILLRMSGFEATLLVALKRDGTRPEKKATRARRMQGVSGIQDLDVGNTERRASTSVTCV